MPNDAPHIGIALFGGLGIRFGSQLPKQFLDCGGKPLMAYVLEAFEQAKEIDEIIVVCHPEYREKTEEVIRELGIAKVSAIIPGGEARSDSSWAALSYLKESGLSKDAIVLIQDGDRPALDQELIKENILAAEKEGAALTAIPSHDTCFLSNSGQAMDSSLPRKEVYRAQTPQSFRFGLIYEAYQHAQGKEFTDDASVALLSGHRPAIVLGNEDNIKINYPQDLAQFIARRKP